MRKSRPPLISWGPYFLSQAKGELSQTEIDARRVGRTIRKIWLRCGTNMRRSSGDKCGWDVLPSNNSASTTTLQLQTVTDRATDRGRVERRIFSWGWGRQEAPGRYRRPGASAHEVGAGRPLHQSQSSMNVPGGRV